ncbi:MAG: PDZ domain-containing protein [Roseivirga sp.]|nr:PDZ domain-containing protein [Roseivirga sp.]
MKGTFKIVAIAFLAGLAGAFVFQEFISPEPVTEIIRESPAQIAQASFKKEEPLISNSPAVTAAIPVSFKEAAAKSVSSVVYIKNLQRNRRSLSMYDLMFGRERGNSEGVAIGSGSGVIYSKDGYIITNNHVIEGADAIQVMHEKRTYDAKLVGTDPKMDIAVLKIEANDLPAIGLGSSSDVAIGDWVLAVGNPFNLTSTVTAGIVSAIGSESNSVRENFPIELYIQTDAAINPGNSGGALVNTNGELVGINTSIISKTGSYAGYGFAVPSDVVLKIVEDLKKYKYVQKAYIGAQTAEVTEEVAKMEGLKDLNGVFVESVTKGSTADNAGLESGDVITTLNGKAVNNKSSFDELMSALSPGDQVDIEFKRNRRFYDTSLTLTNIFGDTKILTSETGLNEDDIFFSDFLGAEFRRLTREEREKLGIRYGVKVTKINQKNGWLRNLEGLEEGHIVTSVNRQGVNNPEGLAEYIERYTGRIYINVIDERGRKETLRYTFR